MKYFVKHLLLILLFLYTNNNILGRVDTHNYSQDIITLYNKIEGEKPNIKVFEQFIIGYNNLVDNKQIITIIDYSLSANKKRLWVIDLKLKKTLYHTLVAHGKNSGQEYARKFSNVNSSYQSSLGFYKTANIYYGKHGFSLVLEGLENGINDQAKERHIVMHSAKYVNPDFINKYGRLGRSLGCPAIPISIHKELIDKIKNGTYLFMYANDQNYLNTSTFYSKTD